MFTPVGKLINSPRPSKTSEAFFALQIRKTFADVLAKSDLPKAVCEAARATSFKNGELTVKVQGLARAELAMGAGGLVKDINKRLGRQVVLKIKFRSY